MVICPFFSGKTVAVFGMGKTGLASVNSLIASNAKVYALDDKPENLSSLPADVRAEISALNWKEIDYLVLSPGVPLYAPEPHEVVKAAQAGGTKIIADLDVLFLANPQAKYIGITGTNGKSTTTALIGHILKELGREVAVGGNIGVPALDLPILSENGYYVLELSSYQLDLLAELKLDAAVFINITPDHISRHGTFERYLEAKQKIMNIRRQDAFGVICIDYPELKNFAGTLSDVKSVSTLENADVSVQARVLKCEGRTFDFNDYSYLMGRHNEENIGIAYALCVNLGLSSEKVIAAIKSFKGLAHRMEVVLQTRDLLFVNDSKATNADAAEKSLLSYNNIYWIAGGQSKEGGIQPLTKLIKERVKMSLLIGAAQDEFATTLEAIDAPYVKLGTLEAAIEYIRNIDAQGVVLLAPACASWDQFKSFEHRGEVFSKLVKENFGNV